MLSSLSCHYRSREAAQASPDTNPDIRLLNTPPHFPGSQSQDAVAKASRLAREAEEGRDWPAPGWGTV